MKIGFPSRRHRPSHCPPRHRGHPGRSSSRSSQSQWQTHSPSLRRVTRRRSCGRLSHKTAGSSLVRISITRTVQRTVGAAGYPEPPFARVCLNFNHLHIQSRRETSLGHVTPVVCPRLIEFLTTLTFRARRRNHILSKALKTIASKKKVKESSLSTCDQLLCREKKRDPMSMTLQKKKTFIKGFFSITVSMSAKTISVSKKPEKDYGFN